MHASGDEQEEREELPPVTADEDDDDNDPFRRLSDDDENDDDDDEPRMPTKRARFTDGQPRRVKSEKPPYYYPRQRCLNEIQTGQWNSNY